MPYDTPFFDIDYKVWNDFSTSYVGPQKEYPKRIFKCLQQRIGWGELQGTEDDFRGLGTAVWGNENCPRRLVHWKFSVPYPTPPKRFVHWTFVGQQHYKWVHWNFLWQYELESFNTDTLLKRLDNESDFSTDTLLKRLDNFTSFSTNTLVKKTNNLETLSTDTLLKRLDNLKSFTTNTLLKKTNNAKTFGTDTNLVSWTSSYQFDGISNHPISE